MSQLPSLPRRAARPSVLIGGEKPKNIKSALSMFSKELKPFTIRIIISFILCIASNTLSIFGPRVLGMATTIIYEGVVSQLSGGPGIDYAKVGSTLSLLFEIYCLSAVFSYIVEFLMAVVSQRIGYDMRKRLAHKISRLPMLRIDALSRGEILSRLTNDVDSLSANINASIITAINSVITMLGVAVMMAIINLPMTLAALIMIPSCAWLVHVIVRRSQNQFVIQQEYIGKANAQVEEAFSAIDVIQAYNREAEMSEKYATFNNTLMKAAFKTTFFSGLMIPLTSFVGNASYVAVCILGGYLAMKGAIKVGDIQSFSLYVRAFTMPVSSMAQTVNMLQSMAAASERIYSFLDEPEEPSLEKRVFPLDSIKGEVKFEHATFSYVEGDPVIEDFSTFAAPGNRIAIVGPTGAGKTTIVKLLLRFYDLSSGRILIDGLDTSFYSRSSVRKAFGIVLQDAWLFSGTIMENIRFGRRDATDEEVIEAAKQARAHSFIMQLPGGYNMALNEDATNISHGQKQLLAIARAFISNPKILVLDEATSSVDTRTEALISEAVERLTRGKTSFVIAHRLSTIKGADQILYIENGELLESGKHEELMNINGAYAKLFRSQFDTDASAGGDDD